MKRAEELARSVCGNEWESAKVVEALLTYAREERQRCAKIFLKRVTSRHGYDKYGDADAIEKLEDR